MSSEVLAESKKVRFGKNGFYDIRLLREAPEKLVVEVTHDLYFKFVPNDHDPKIDWTSEQKQGFLETWKSQIAETWNTEDHIVIAGNSLSLRFVSRFADSAEDTHFQVKIFRLKDRTKWRQSAVCRGCYAGGFDAEFDSNDDLIRKLGRQKTQTAIKHEFGHMIGLPDEYRRSPDVEDKPSIMNNGSAIRERHLQHFVDWARRYVKGPEGEGMAKSDKPALPSFLLQTSDKTAAADAVRDWKEALSAGEVVVWSVRSRETGNAVPVDEVDPENFSALEVIFEEIAGDPVDIAWSPPSQDALEALLEGS